MVKKITEKNQTIPINWKRAGKRLTEIRENMGVSREQVAVYLDIPESKLERIEQGETVPRLSQLLKLSDLYCMDEFSLLYDEEFDTTYKGFPTKGFPTIGHEKE